MKPKRNFVQTLAEISLLVLLALVMIVVFRTVSSGVQNRPITKIPDTPPPYPAPTEGVAGTAYPAPGETAAVQDRVSQTPPATPVYPRLTPTPRPGVTEVAWPLPTLADNPEGIVWYTSIEALPNQDYLSSSYSNFAIKIGADGNPIGPSDLNLLLTELDSRLDHKIYSIYPSPNGKYFVVCLPSEPGVRPYVFNLESREIKSPLEEYAPGMFLGWHPDSRRFLFFVDGGGPWLVDAETSEITKLALELNIQGGAIAPDGSMIAYIAYDVRAKSGDGINQALWFVSSLGSDAKPVLSTGSVSYIYPNAWSPDGKRIVYYGSCDDPGRAGPLCLFNIDTGELRALKIPSFFGRGTVWSPTGRYIAATGLLGLENECKSEGLTEIEKEACQLDEGRIVYIEDITSGEAFQFTSGYGPVWSPDGSMLAFFSERSGSPEVWISRLDGTGLQQITTDGQQKGLQLHWTREIGK